MAHPSTPSPAHSEPIPATPSRRAFLGGGLGVAALTGGGILLPSLIGANRAGAAPGAPSKTPRRVRALRVRQDAAHENFQVQTPTQTVNGDETFYPAHLASFSKGLPHNAYGEVDTQAYALFKAACEAGTYESFEAVPAGELDPALSFRLVNPLAGVAFDMEGSDVAAFAMRAAPAFASAEQAGEMVEDYWMALLRDVPFRQYATHPVAAAACADLSWLSDFRGPKDSGSVTPALLFREDLPGALAGPLVSQFFWRSLPFGAHAIDPRIRTTMPGVDHMTTAPEWLAIQNGRVPSASEVFDPVPRYVRNGRDFGAWVHVDVLFQAFLQAALNLTAPPSAGGLDVAPNSGNPYLQSTRQAGFATFGGPALMSLLGEVATRALKAMWYQKWMVHRRQRPESFAGRVHHKLVSGRPYPIHGDVLGSQALAEIYNAHGSYFLPMAYPEGSPLHPSYGAGHAAVAGACATVLKALLDTDVPFQGPMEATDDGLGLQPYNGADAGLMTVEGEINKLAHNIAYGRNMAGVHWRTDGIESMKVGEAVTLSVLRDHRATYAESFNGYTLRRFDGTVVTI